MRKPIALSSVEMRVLFESLRTDLGFAFQRYSEKANIDLEMIRDEHVAHLELARHWMDKSDAPMLVVRASEIRRSIRTMNQMVEEGHYNIDRPRNSRRHSS